MIRALSLAAAVAASTLIPAAPVEAHGRHLGCVSRYGVHHRHTWFAGRYVLCARPYAYQPEYSRPRPVYRPRYERDWRHSDRPSYRDRW